MNLKDLDFGEQSKINMKMERNLQQSIIYLQELNKNSLDLDKFKAEIMTIKVASDYLDKRDMSKRIALAMQLRVINMIGDSPQNREVSLKETFSTKKVEGE